MVDITLVVFTVYGLLTILLLALILLAVYRLLRKLRTYLLGGTPAELFGTDPKVRLISLGAATLVFYNVPLALVETAAGVLYRFVGAMKDALLKGFAAAAQCGDYNKLAPCASGLLYQFIEAWATGFREAYNAVPAGFPYASLILYLALWATVAYLLGETQAGQGQHVANMRRGQRWVSEAYKRLGWNATLNLLFFLILALGSYLSIASIIAIPILQDNAEVSDELSVASLRQRLTGRLKNIDGDFADGGAADGKSLERVVALTGGVKDLEAKPDGAGDGQKAADSEPGQEGGGQPEGAGQNAGAATQASARGDAPSATPTPAATPNGEGDRTQPTAGDGGSSWDGGWNAPPAFSAEQFRQRVREDLSRFQRVRREMFKAWKDLRSKGDQNQRVALESAVTAYELNLKKKGAGEKGRREHMLILAQWFDERAMNLEYLLSNCQSAVSREEERVREWADAAELALGAKTPDAQRLVGYRYSSAASGVYDEMSTWREMCNAALLPSGEPWRPTEGTSLGYFRLIAQWLVSTELLPLALITGLLGFGLLGSACSTFIREHEQRTSKETAPAAGWQAAAQQQGGGTQGTRLLVSDLTSVVIRGMSAAIVVFLAVEGGLAIFASEGSEPNPYVLLLTCFVGAVFSESVWKWARQKYLDGLGKDGDDNRDADKDKDHEAENSVAAEAALKANEAADAADAAAKAAHEASAKAAEAEKVAAAEEARRKVEAEEARRKAEAAAAPPAAPPQATTEAKQQTTATETAEPQKPQDGTAAAEGGDGSAGAGGREGDKDGAIE